MSKTLKYTLLFNTLFIISSVSFSNENFENNFNEKECKVVKRLDGPGGIYENLKIQNQGALSTCYANTSSIMLQGLYNKEHKDKPIDQISWLHLAYLTQKEHLEGMKENYFDGTNTINELFNKGGRLCSLYEAIKGKKLCELESDFYDEGQYKKNLESNTDTLRAVLNNFEDLLSIDSFYETLKKPEQKIISPNCIDRLNNNLDQLVSKEVINNFEENDFNELLPLMNQTNTDEAELKHLLKERFIIQNFTRKKDNQNFFSLTETLNASGWVSFSFNTSKEDDLSFIKKYFKSDFLDKENNFTQLSFDALDTVSTRLNEKFKDIFLNLKKEQEKDLISCINQTLLNEDELLISLGTPEVMCKTSSLTEPVFNFFEKLLSYGFNPDYIVKLLNSKNLYSREALFDEMMQELYTNCEVEIPKDLVCETVYRESIPSDYETPSDLVFAGVKNQLEGQGVSTYLAFKFDFMKSEEEKANYKLRSDEAIKKLTKELSTEKDAQKKEEIKKRIDSLNDYDSYTHAVSVLGYSEGCGEEKKRCLLIQNSFGEAATDNTNYYNKNIIPDKKITYHYSETDSYTEYSYGKFWLCDDEIINSNFTNIARLRKND